MATGSTAVGFFHRFPKASVRSMVSFLPVGFAVFLDYVNTVSGKTSPNLQILNSNQAN